MRRRMLGISILTLLAIVGFAYSAPKETMATFHANNGWAFMVHLKPIPKQHQKMVNATHHIAVTITNSQGKAVSDLSVKFIFKSKGKIVAQGELKYMSPGAQQGGGHGAHAQEGHYGADVNLPGAGDYNLTLIAKDTKNLTMRASGTIKVTE